MFAFSDFYNVVFEVYSKDKLIKKQTAQAPKEILMINFMQMAEQIKNDKRPMKIKMVVPDVIWDNFENKERLLNNEVTASNIAMIDWEENANKQEV